MAQRSKTVSLRSRLMMIAAAGVLPVAVGAGIGMFMTVRDQWRAAESRSLEVVKLTAAAIEVEVQRTYAALYVTSASPLLDGRDLPEYKLLLERVLVEMGDWRALVLMTPEGKPLVSVGEGPVGELPGITDSQSLAHVVRLRTPFLGNMVQNDRQQWGIPVRVPVERNGKLVYVLTAILKPDVFYKAIKTQPFPPDWVMAVYDRRGIRVARSHEHLELLGQPAPPLLWKMMMDEEHATTNRSLEGKQVMSAVVRLESDWIAGIGIPTDGVWVGALQAFALYGTGVTVALLLALFGAALIARRINEPIAQLGHAAEQMGRGDMPFPPDTRIHELANLGRALRAAAQARAVLESDRKAALAEADELEYRLGVALDSSAVPFSILSPVHDDSGVIVDFAWDYLNRAAAQDIQHEVPELTHKAIGQVAPQTWRIPELFEAYVRAAEGGQPQEVEVTAEAGTERERTLQVIATPIGKRLAVWSADVTHRKQQERALQAADRRKDEFLAILAHELRNPLAPIQQAAMIASMPTVTDSQKRWSQEVIGRQVKHMALLLEDLLDVSRITRGKLELRRSRMDLREAIDAAVETARPHLEDKSHRLIVTLPPEPVYLDADALRLAQVITNLLTNAARYTDAGGEIRLSAEAARSRVTLTVEDTGMGIASEHLERIFEMFSQGQHRAAQGGGLGIGLALARGIAQLHGGTLSATSSGPGRGSKFSLTLPLAGQLGAAAHEPQRLAIEPVPSKRILVADDNRDAADTLVSLLRMSGHQVWVAYDGYGALREYESRKPDVVMLDIGMPNVSGYEVARRIRKMTTPTDAPLLIALTGWGQVKDKANAAGAGFDHHLTKPVDVPALFKLLRLPDHRKAAANG